MQPESVLMRKKRAVKVVVLAGGSCLFVAEDLDIINGDIGVAIDVSKEMEEVHLDPRVIPVVLGDSGTLSNLISHFVRDPELKDVIQSLDRRADLSNGMGQVPMIGKMAYRRFHGLEAIHRQVLQQVRQISNGAPQRIIVQGMGSFSGGTGSGTLVQAVFDLVSYLDKATSAVINVHFVGVGALTYTGLGQGSRVGVNSYYGLAYMLTKLLDPDSSADVVSTAMLTELPLDGEDTALRIRHMRAIVQALTSTGLARATRDSNESTHNSSGRINTAQAGMWAPEQMSLRFHAASEFLADFQALSTGGLDPNTQIPALSLNLRFVIAESNDHNTVLELAHDRGNRFEGLWEKLTQKWVIETRQEEVTIQGSEKVLPLANVLNRAPPMDFEAYKARLSELLALQKAFTDERDVALAEVEKARRELRRLSNDIDVELAWLMPNTIPEKIASKFGNFDDHLGHLDDLLTDYANQEERQQCNQFKANLLDDAVRPVRVEINKIREYVVRAEEWISDICSQPGKLSDWYLYAPFSRVFTRELDALKANDQAHFEDVLVRAVTGVTQKGLAMILGLSETASYPEIAQQLNTEPPLLTPPWGSLHRRDSTPRQYVIVPPCPQEVFNQLQFAMQDQKSPRALHLATSMNGGGAVVLLDVHFVEGIEHVLTREMAYELEIAEPGDAERARHQGQFPIEQLAELLTN
jgi:tubulin-like protein